VADCFKYRNQIGLEVALEALLLPAWIRAPKPNYRWSSKQACEGKCCGLGNP
jgi:hypothetical protein